jgi:hypothetical protein
MPLAASPARATRSISKPKTGWGLSNEANYEGKQVGEHVSCVASQC